VSESDILPQRYLSIFDNRMNVRTGKRWRPRLEADPQSTCMWKRTSSGSTASHGQSWRPYVGRSFAEMEHASTGGILNVPVWLIFNSSCTA
jgi:hypothetical protein